mgnify:CR=1 FL=1
MATPREREDFIAATTRESIPLHVARALLRAAATLHRLAEANCNGDYPCDNGERKVRPCTRCESLYAPAALSAKGVCPDCRTEDRVKALLAPFNIVPDFQGDPRGYVLRLIIPSNGREIGVP